MRPHLIFLSMMLLSPAVYGQSGMSQQPSSMRDLQDIPGRPHNIFEPDSDHQAMAQKQRTALAKERLRKINEYTELLRTLTAKLYASMQTHETFNDADRKLLEQIEKAARDAEKWMKQ